MTETCPRQPLWEAMQKAHDVAVATHHPFVTYKQVWAAEILAVRDWLFPEKEEPESHHETGEVNIEWDVWKERQSLRDQLTSEADRVRG